MTAPIFLDDIPVAELVDPRFEDAARLLEQALQVGGPDPQTAYLLALAYKRQGKTAEARAALRKIDPPDANVLLQLGLLSLQENQLGQAEPELAQAWQLDGESLETAYNLLMTRLALGQTESAAALVPYLAGLARDPEEQRFFQALGKMLAVVPPSDAGEFADPPLWEMTEVEERRLLDLLRGIDHFEVVYPLLQKLAAARPGSTAIQTACFEVAVVQAKRLFDRCEWGAAGRLLADGVHGAGKEPTTTRETRAAVANLVGCCACMEQDFERGIEQFTSAGRLAGPDPRIFQNLAVAHEWLGDLEQADLSWNRFLDLLDHRLPMAPGRPDYGNQLGFEVFDHLADIYAKKERWPAALNYLHRAYKLRPQDADLLERLFHLYVQLKRPDDARRALQRLRQVRPSDPQLDLYELDLQETKTLDDLDRVLNDIGRILRKHPNDLRVEERAVGMVGNVIPLMSRLCDQLTEQMNRVMNQVRHLPHYQVNWAAVREVMRDLEDEFLRLRQITRLCLPLVTTDEHRRIIRDLSGHIDRKIDDCRRVVRR
jgi:tetratricopeptide (TPR) repeat protein